MSIEMNMPNAAEQITAVIIRHGKTTPLETIIREGVVNGSEANRRQLGTGQRGDVYIKRDDILKNKLAIVNVGGEFFSEEKAKNNLNTLYNSGNKNMVAALAANMGQGAKISALPHMKDGILYRSQNLDEEVPEGTEKNITFQMKLLESGKFGIQDKYCEFIESNTEFQHCDLYNREMEGNFGTEMVLMGNSPEEDTWDILCEECSSGRSQSSTGWSIYKYISNRFFRDIGDNIYVQVNAEENKRAKVVPVYDIMSRAQSYSFSAISGEGVPDGTILHYCLKKDYEEVNSAAKFANLNGNVYVTWKKEIYFDNKESAATRSRRLRDAGLWNKPTDWILIVELPDSWEGAPSESRTQLININEFQICSAICDNLPEDIQEWMQQNKDDNFNSDDTRSWLKDIFKGMKGKTPGSKKGDGAQSTLPSGTKSKSTGIKKDGNSKRGKRQSIEDLKNMRVPEPQTAQWGEDGPLYEFNFSQYKILLNTDHKLFVSRQESFLETFSHLDPSVVTKAVENYHFKAVVSRIFEIQNIYSSASIGEREKKWASDVLEATWNYDSSTAVRRNLGRHKNTAKAENKIKE